MCILLGLVLGLATGFGNEEPLDTFVYADAAAAARAWVASPGTPAARMAGEQGRPAMVVELPFGRDPKLERTIHDRSLAADLSAFGGFTLELVAEEPAAVGQVSLYFRSGKGWYAAGTGLAARGRQTLRFSKASFRVEGTPDGWQKINGVRISFWRGSARDAEVRLLRLAAVWNDVAVVIPSAAQRAKDRELSAAVRNAELVSDLLAEMGVECDAIEDTPQLAGGLARRRVVLVAYHPSLSEEAVTALAQHVQSGGKLVLCYQLPPRLGEVLGFGSAKYVRPDRPDQFAEMRFEAPDVAGLPKTVRQNSWNITAAEPVAFRARVIGRWFDAQGQPTGQPAVLLSDRGAFFSHIVLGEDRPAKKQMLAAVLGALEPALWESMLRAEQARLDRAGHLASTEQVVRYVQASKNPAAAERLKLALTRQAAMAAHAEKRQFAQAVELGRQAQKLLAEAYLRATPSRSPEARAFWNHSGTGAYPGDWDRTCRELRAAGFNMVLPNMLWGGLAHYASDVLPRSRTFAQYGDQIAQCVEAAHRHGIEVHVWKVNYNLSTAPREFVEEMRQAGRTQVAADGSPVRWLCPSHPENVKLECESMLEVARKYDVDGLHFDYIRYPDGETCYCSGCRQRFEHQRGKPVPHWPQDCYRGPLRDEYRQWRCQQITQLVETVAAQARKLKPELKISAAVFGAYPGCRESVGQDWLAWVQAGYVDFLCPMDYTESDLAFEVLVSNQLKLVAGRVPVYPGIGATASRSALSPDRVVGQIQLARQLGAAGFTVFNLSERTAAEILPAVGLGAGAQPADPPHRQVGPKR